MGALTMTLEPLRSNERLVLRPASYFGSWKSGWHLYRETYRRGSSKYSVQAIVSGPRGVIHFKTIGKAQEFAWLMWGEKAERVWTA